jgi:Ca2+-transporting ATPase
VSRLRQFGYNELPATKPRTLPRIAVGVLREPMLALLLAALIIYFLLGDSREASVLGAFVVVVIGITLYQEHKAERALDALRDLSSPRALVIRNGERVRISGREVVPGDLLILSEGDRVPADGFLLSATSLSIDESLLTGESVPVRKLVGPVPENQIRNVGGDDTPFVFSGTLVVRGYGIARAETTGVATELGKIGKSLEGVRAEPTLLQKDAHHLIRVSAVIALLVCSFIAIVYGLTRGDWLRGFLAALSTAMSLLPEELPVVLTIFLAVGAWRISRLNVLTRRVPAIETLGAATVLCVDKTGTLTMNQMAVKRLISRGECFEAERLTANEMPEPLQELTEFAVLASRTNSVDPMDLGIRRFGEAALANTDRLHRDWSFTREYPLDADLLAVSEVWMPLGQDRAVIASKGAPEAIAGLCRMGRSETEWVLGQTATLARDGLRVLGVAKGSWRGELPETQTTFSFTFVGLVAMADPIRSSVAAAIQECADAGIKVVMITGDYAGTAVSIARQAGLGSDPGVITGPQLADMSEESLRDRISTTRVFARAVPGHKLRLVNALKAQGEVVAMTGDGVNDAPALKAAHIGIAMGRRGTDVAREAADLVLLDDDFSSIVKAVRMGRRIFDNLRKAIAYTFAVHVPIVGLSLIPVLLGWPLILAPVHIAFLELIIDPACSIVFEAEAEETNIMRRPPRRITERLFDKRTILLSMIQGVGVLLILLAVFAVALYWGQGETDARALAFCSLVVANLALIQTNRSWLRGFLSAGSCPNRAMAWVTGGALSLLVLVLYLPPLRHIFNFSVLHPNDIALCIGAGLGSVAWFEVLKMFTRRRKASSVWMQI